ncbi:MAG: response regulator [Desulfocapsa sp.]|nr:response regulator [Desulfocapsa sp.]
MIDLSGCTVLIVDDVESNIDILIETLDGEYEISVAMDGESALESVEVEIPDLILLDIMMPGMNGYEVCRALKENPATKDIPVIFLTAMIDEANEEKGLMLGAVDYITKPFSPELVQARVHNQLELKVHKDNLDFLVQERTKQVELTQEVTIESMGTLAEYRDPETGGHIQRTKKYVKILAQHLQLHPKFCDFLDDATIEILYQSAPLHDIGKVGVPDGILLKNGRLTVEEFEVMKKHAVYGREVIAISEKRLGQDSFLRHACIIAGSHHEKWDGSGYPDGLKGDGIPIQGRIMAIADVYDALISKRPYKEPLRHKDAVKIITEGRGAHFDPDMADAFLELEDEFRKIALAYADFDEERERLSEGK